VTHVLAPRMRPPRVYRSLWRTGKGSALSRLHDGYDRQWGRDDDGPHPGYRVGPVASQCHSPGGGGR
jgi:hypothetical protein